jgi:hypothetical protein
MCKALELVICGLHGDLTRFLFSFSGRKQGCMGGNKVAETTVFYTLTLTLSHMWERG